MSSMLVIIIFPFVVCSYLIGTIVFCSCSAFTFGCPVVLLQTVDDAPSCYSLTLEIKNCFFFQFVSFIKRGVCSDTFAK